MYILSLAATLDYFSGNKWIPRLKMDDRSFDEIDLLTHFCILTSFLNHTPKRWF